MNHFPEDRAIVQVRPIGFRTRVEAEREIGIVCRVMVIIATKSLVRLGATNAGKSRFQIR